MTTKDKVLLKIAELECVIKRCGDEWMATQNRELLSFVCRRIEAKLRLKLYLKNLSE